MMLIHRHLLNHLKTILQGDISKSSTAANHFCIITYRPLWSWCSGLVSWSTHRSPICILTYLSL